VTEDVVYEWLNGLGGTSSTKVPWYDKCLHLYVDFVQK
jgi:hypothetical protein